MLMMKKLKKKQILIETLKNHSIKHTNQFELLVYDSPYKILNRRNEVLVVYNQNKTKNI